MAALLVAMTGCQKEPQVTPDEQTPVGTKGYVSVAIKLPTSNSTKAYGDYHDGIADEYNVTSTALLFFDKNNKFVHFTSPTMLVDWADNDADEITKTAQTEAISLPVAGVEKVLAILNFENLLTVSAGELTEFGTIAVTKNTTTFEDMNVELSKTAVELTTKGGSPYFLMTNAPETNGTGVYTYLDAVTVFPKADQAIGNPALIQVERAVAKVELFAKGDASSFDAYLPNSAIKVGQVTIQNWALDMTNTVFFPVRQCSADWYSGGWVNKGIYKSPYLHYALDPNYLKDNAATDETDFTKIAVSAIGNSLSNASEAHPLYCLENTFEHTNQNKNATTRILIKAQYAPIDKNDAQLSFGATWFQVGPTKTIYNVDDLKTLVQEKDNTITNDQWNTYISNLTAGKQTDKNVGSKKIEDLVGDVICYKDGLCYYPVLIRHFSAEDNNYGPADAEDQFIAAFETRGGAYEPQDLGRYGVVRNNWYKVTVNSFSGPGSPAEPGIGDGTDDTVERYCSCSIDILAWCLREHGVDL